MKEGVRAEANAKINLYLRVVRLRRDGYHELDSAIEPIGLSDVVTCRESRRLDLTLEAADPSLSGGPDNLAVVAALALAEACGAPKGAEIHLEKHIPVAAGLGGGSADAAAVLRVLNELWGCGLQKEALFAVAAAVGSDVPAMLAGRPARVRGRGERLQALEVPPHWWVIVPFDFHVRTPDSFRWWDEDGSPHAAGTKPKAVLSAVASGDAATLAGAMFNDLEGPVFARHPEAAAAKATLLAAGALGAVMCGSGPTVAGMVATEVEALALSEKIPGSIPAAALVNPG